jgi:hypothetical protein
MYEPIALFVNRTRGPRDKVSALTEATAPFIGGGLFGSATWARSGTMIYIDAVK